MTIFFIYLKSKSKKKKIIVLYSPLLDHYQLKSLQYHQDSVDLTAETVTILADIDLTAENNSILSI